MQDLKALIDESYQLFGLYEVGDVMAVCSGQGCCLQPCDAELLKSLPVQNIEPWLIYEFLEATETENITLLVQQMKYLLPRILELLIQEQKLRISKEFIFDKCRFNCDLWLKQEVDFMQRFASAYFDSKCTAAVIKADAIKGDNTLEDIIVMFHIAGLDIQPLLNQWQTVIDQVEPFNNFIFMVICNFEMGKYESAFEDEALNRKMTDWISEKNFKSKVLKILNHKLIQPDITPKQQWEYGKALDYLSLPSQKQ